MWSNQRFKKITINQNKHSKFNNITKKNYYKNPKNLENK